LHVRRAVAEFVPDPNKYQRKADVSLSMSGESWVKIYLSRATPEELIKQGEIKVKGNATEAAQLLDLFDRYKPEKAMVIPPALFGNAG
jgi:alkyl sulfatase BDS1-like metallo-beta-lactamase superfamily hydrolase